MIRYSITEKKLKQSIRETDADWLDEAETATGKLKSNKVFSKIGPKWGRIKSVFMNAQHNKCGFCERLLPSVEYGRIEHDVEHFRPKSRMLKWPPRSRRDLHYDFDTGEADGKGYYWLAYDPLNYLTACKTCNSNRKRDYFPIKNQRGSTHGSVRKLLGEEKPFLVYPLTAIDDDPEKLIGFNGVAPVAKGTRGHRRRRAEIIIDFFSLDRREELIRERFAVIDRLIHHLENRENGDSRIRARAERRIMEMIADDAEHANCARSYLRLFEQNPRLAWDYYEQGENILAEVRGLMQGV